MAGVAVRTGAGAYFATATDVDTRTVIVQGFSWTGATDASHTLAFEDGAGVAWLGPFSQNAVFAPLVVMFTRPIKVTGLEVSVLGSGVVNVFYA